MTALELLQEYGQEVDVVHNYSGRGMYGRQCPAIIGDRYNLLAVLFDIAKTDPDSFDGFELQSWKEDDMGMLVVFYWPHLGGSNENW